MKTLTGIHHVAIICSNYETSKRFYNEILGFEIEKETFREDRQSYKLDLKISENLFIELFSFPDSPSRPSYPEACGLRHLAFKCNNLELTINDLKQNGIAVEEIRIDKNTNKKFAFFSDPDGLPLELYGS